ncbi:MAG: hypothetical protein KJP00_04440 [Bacteroidia bacterium]|nr:hypothetical protein [Bacteroidia bacterium]
MKVMQLMKSNFNLLIILFSILSLTIVSCDDDDPEVDPISITFNGSSGSIAENSATPFTVTINSSIAAPGDGSVDVSITGANYGTQYTNSVGSASFTASFTQGASFASFTLSPVDNNDVDGDKVLTITLSNPSGLVELGTQTTYTLTIQDDDVALTPINFAETSATISETNGAYTVNLNLDSNPNSMAGGVNVDVTGGVYGTDFTTDPVASGGTISLNVPAITNTVSFTVTPEVISTIEDEKVITFTLSNPTGGVELGSSTTFTLTITDQYTPISAVRAMYDGSADIDISTDMVIRGIVTSINDAVTSRNLFIQDATGAIVLRFTETHSFPKGNDIEVNLNGAQISDFSDLVQITNGLELSAVTDMGAGTMITPETITIEQLNSGSYQAQYVQVENLSFTAADGSETFSGNKDVSDGTNMAVVRTESYAPWAGDALPLGMGAIKGLAGVFSGTSQLLPQSRSDVFDNMPAGSIAITQAITDFGSVMTNGNSTSQSYTILTVGATENIMVSASDNFEVSLDDVTFAGSVMVDYTLSNVGALTLYVRFSPTTGIAGNKSGTITHSSTGLSAIQFQVSGTETSSQSVIASTSFEEMVVGSQYTDTGDASMDHDLVNNPGESEVDFTASATEIGVDASYFATRDMGSGLTDGDFVGVSDFAGVVGAFTDGTQGYQMSDCDGKMRATFDAIDISSFTTATVSLDIFVQSTGWESDDAIRIWVVGDGGTEIDILNTNGMDLDDNFGELEGIWTTLSMSVSGNSSVQLIVELDSNSGSESIYLDNVQFFAGN